MKIKGLTQKQAEKLSFFVPVRKQLNNECWTLTVPYSNVTVFFHEEPSMEAYNDVIHYRTNNLWVDLHKDINSIGIHSWK